MTDPRLGMLEDDLKRAVIDLAHAHGWLVAHFRPARTDHGYRTPVEADGAGFPDLVLAHYGAGRLVFAELKRQTAPKPTEAQVRWLDTLGAVAKAVIGRSRHGDELVEVALWRPADLIEARVDDVLRVSPAERAAAVRRP